ncbi:alpha/beta hydrolase fold protein [Bifidobacterium actinocoloniiforme DSM 22766]|uniref:Alpha/beta hydrolase fold protein n=1 Tax=Bifidobacterium actinocoloniiforme DSM 22766 TaxID=1437605 RepID=A0A086YWE9_9BIFI|nr:alpha/beta fold hydrolase [Bifidobacterium actinocoloniiforme]AKV55798.1 lysophospholipase [Bifidobacterium actinocoloniiforme DSM 22766]KFI38599.1 alpha/beta hydrolase fold protein [Bifidobacterium actinocoloniiforme DSM 22766]
MELDLIDEGQYEQTMRQTVLPALEACKREGWMCSNAPGDDGTARFGPADLPGRRAVVPTSPDRLHYVCYEAARFDELGLPGSQGLRRGAVVISHGFTEFAGKYSEMAWYFLLAGYTVCILEHWGHGLSGRGLDDPNLVWVDSYRRYVDDLAVFCKEVAVDYGGDLPICLYSHSMGAGVAASLLERYPALVDRAVLSSPMIAPRTGLPLGLTNMVMNAACGLGMGQCKVPGHHRFDPHFDPGSVGNASQARLRWNHGLRAADPAYQTSAATYGWVRQAIAMSRDVLKPALCERVEGSTLVFQASPDALVPPKPQERFVNQVRVGGCQIDLVRVPNATHELYTMPNRVLSPYLERILTFFSEPDSLAGSDG